MPTDNQTTSPSQRLGGGKNIGVQRSSGRSGPSGAALVSGASRRLGGGKNVGSQKGAGSAQEQAGESAGLPKLGGVAWWLMLGLMIGSDIGSVLCGLLVTAGIGLSAALVTAPIGIPLAVVGWAAGVLVSFNAFMFSMGYYLFNKVPLMGARKLATMGVSAIIELIPMVSMLPMLTIAFLIITITENMKRGSGIVGKLAQKVISKTPVGRVANVAGAVLSKA
ncbi:MAG: hypothetical protein Q7S52_01615 [bacterium]|nr:hypothetical protein [bacterium]